MTMYTEDVNYRMRTVFFFIAVFSVVLALALHGVMPSYPWIIAPATLTFYGVVFWLFDAILWKLPVIRRLNSGIPNLAGDWAGKLSRGVGADVQQIDVKLRIRQTWSKLQLVLETSEAKSRNTLAGLRLKDPGAIVLTWIYEKQGSGPRSLLDAGRGIIELTLRRKSSEPSMEGAELSGSFIESTPGEPVQIAFLKPGPFYWNPEPF